MEDNPHFSHNYSHEMMLKSAFEYELRNNLKVNPKYDNMDMAPVIEYLTERLTEIRDRWK